MHHSTSGKFGREMFEVPTASMLTRAQLEALVRREDELRVSTSWQARFAEKDSDDWWAEQCNLLQHQAILDLFPHFDEQQRKQVVVLLRCSRKRFSHDASFYKPVYVRFDRTMQNGLPMTGPALGKAVTDVACLHPIVPESSAPIALSGYLDSLPKHGDLALPVVIFAGSLS